MDDTCRCRKTRKEAAVLLSKAANSERMEAVTMSSIYVILIHV